MQSEIIPVELAASMRRRGLSWKEIGYRIAEQQQREKPFQASSVKRAVCREFGTSRMPPFAASEQNQ